MVRVRTWRGGLTISPVRASRRSPPRCTWTYPFEGFIRRVKLWGNHSNHKNVPLHIATMMSLQSALELEGL